MTTPQYRAPGPDDERHWRAVQDCLAAAETAVREAQNSIRMLRGHQQLHPSPAAAQAVTAPASNRTVAPAAGSPGSAPPRPGETYPGPPQHRPAGTDPRNGPARPTGPAFPPRPDQAREHRTTTPRSARRLPQLTTEQWILRIIAGAGIGITVVGVGFAVAVAIQSGWLGPLWRVILSAVLAVVLLGAALILERRNGPPVGIAALAVTSVLTAFLLVLALVGALAWWIPEVGAVGFLLLWSVYLYCYRAYGWRAVGVTVTILGLGLSAAYPSYSFPDTGGLVWLTAALPLIALAATWGDTERLVRRWAVAAIAVASLLHLSYLDAPQYAYLVAVAGMLSIVVTSLGDPLDRRTNVGYGGGAAAVTVFLAALLAPSAVQVYLLTAAVLAAYLFASSLPRPHRDELPRAVRVGAGCLIPLTLLIPVFWRAEITYPGTFTTAGILTTLIVLVGFVVFYFLYPVTGSPTVERTAVWWAWVLALVIAATPVLVAVVGLRPLALTTSSALLTGLVIGIVVGCLILRPDRFDDLALRLVWTIAAVGLLYSMIAVVSVSVWIAHTIGGLEGVMSGFLVGHSVVSVGWMLIAAWVLLGRTRVPVKWSLWIGSALAAAAVLKLVFFDLQALTGIARALAFLACGLVLLTIVSLRARQDTSPADPAVGGGDPRPAQAVP